LGAAAGTVPLALALLAGSVGGKPAKPAGGTHGTRIAATDLQFNPGCRMPFQSSPVPAIDGECSIEGAGTTDEKIAESKTKNDFCSPTANVASIEYQTFLDLQKATSFRKSADRSPLHKISLPSGVTLGEGEYVEYSGFLLHAQYSNKGSGEAVNCNIPGEDTNDIHIQLVNDPSDDDACNSVTAQMSPHFRPESWTPEKLNSTRDTMPDKKGVLQGRLIRLRGPLFFDGSHAPCRNGKRPNPQRASVWEIHPVYSVDVCLQKGPKCKDSDWVSLEEWNGVEGGEGDEE
jgi:hypothetical protein